MDDERLKNAPGPGQDDYFERLLERIEPQAVTPLGRWLGGLTCPQRPCARAG